MYRLRSKYTDHIYKILRFMYTDTLPAFVLCFSLCESLRLYYGDTALYMYMLLPRVQTLVENWNLKKKKMTEARR